MSIDQKQLCPTSLQAITDVTTVRVVATLIFKNLLQSKFLKIYFKIAKNMKIKKLYCCHTVAIGDKVKQFLF